MFAAISSALNALEKTRLLKDHESYEHSKQSYSTLKDIFKNIQNENLQDDELAQDCALLSFYLFLEYLYATAVAREYLRPAYSCK